MNVISKNFGSFFSLWNNSIEFPQLSDSKSTCIIFFIYFYCQSRKPGVFQEVYKLPIGENFARYFFHYFKT